MIKKLSTAIAAIVALGSTPSQAQISSELYDYMVQDVCVDGANRAIAGDPATCANRRNIGLYEASPYIVTDFNNQNGEEYYAWNSIPVLGEDGRTRVLTVKKRSAKNQFNGGFQFSWSTPDDGFDLADINYSSYASFIRTYDAGCLDQAFAPTNNSWTNRFIHMPNVRAGGWVLFPLASPPSAWAQINAISNGTARIQLQSKQGCSNGSSTARTYWNAPANYRFETGKVLRAIKSAHFAATDLSSGNNALEMFYFTKEYGFTRWEAWVPRSRCVSEAAQVPSGQLRVNCYPENGPAASDEVDLRTRCVEMTSGTSTGELDVTDWGGQDWVRTDCRDMTNYIALNTPQLLLNSTIAQENGVDDIDYPLSSNGPSGPSNPPDPGEDPSF